MPWVIFLTCYLKYPHRFFSSHSCFLDFVVLLFVLKLLMLTLLLLALKIIIPLHFFYILWISLNCCFLNTDESSSSCSCYLFIWLDFCCKGWLREVFFVPLRFSFIIIIIIIIIIIWEFFQINVSWYFSTGVCVIASFLKPLELFFIFRPISIML